MYNFLYLYLKLEDADKSHFLYLYLKSEDTDKSNPIAWFQLFQISAFDLD